MKVRRVYIKFGEEAKFCQEIRKLTKDLSLCYVGEKFLHYKKQNSGRRIKEITSSRTSVSLETVIVFYNELVKRGKTGIDILDWIEEAEGFTAANGMRVDKDKVKEYLKGTLYDNKS